MINTATEGVENNLWLRNAKYDGLFFHISGLLSLGFVIPYFYYKEASVIPIYNLYLVLFGLPHNYMTWASIFPNPVRKTINLKSVIIPGLVCLAICAALPFVNGHPARNWILTIITISSLWHAYRQHHGIAKIYDAVQVKRTGDQTLFEDRKALNLFFFLGSWAVVVWAFTHEHIKYLLSTDDFYMLVYPQLPHWLLQVYIVATLLTGIYACKRVILDRYKQNKFVPWPQIILMLVALATYIVPYIFIPIEAMPLAVAIATIYHNVQYFGFIWIFERERTKELAKTTTNFWLPQRLALSGSWKSYFLVSLIYSFSVVTIYLISPQSFGLILIYYIAFAHYIIDGFIWKGKNNSFIRKFIANIASQVTESRQEDLSPNLAPVVASHGL